jgi:hypothetical protein
MTVEEKRSGAERRSRKDRAAVWIPEAKTKRDGLAKGDQGLTGDQDRIVGQARLAAKGH